MLLSQPVQRQSTAGATDPQEHNTEALPSTCHTCGARCKKWRGWSSCNLSNKNISATCQYSKFTTSCWKCVQEGARPGCPLPQAGTQQDRWNFSGSFSVCPIHVQCIKPLKRCKVRDGFSLSEGNHCSKVLPSFTAGCVLWTVGSSAYVHVAKPCCFINQRHWHCSWSLSASEECFRWWGSFSSTGCGCATGSPIKHCMLSVLLLPPLHQSLTHHSQPQELLAKIALHSPPALLWDPSTQEWYNHRIID